MQSMLPALSVARPVPVNAVRSAAMRNAAYLAHVASAHSSGANTPLRAASPFLSSSLATTNTSDQSKLYWQYRSSLALASHVQQPQQPQQQSSPTTITTSQISSKQPISTLKSGKKSSRKSKRSSTRATSHHSASTLPATLLRFILLHLPLAAFAAIQLCIALVVAPFLLMFAIGVACGTAFLAAILDMWNPHWWRLVKEHVGSMLRPARRSRRSSSPASSTSPSRSLSSSSRNSNDSKGEQSPEEKPLYERIIDDERRRVRDVTEKVRARRRHQAASLSQLPSSSIMGASLVTGLAGSIEAPLSYSSLPTRRQHRQASSNLRMYKTADYPRRDMDIAYQPASMVKNSEPILTNDTDLNGVSASYHDAAAELAALFNNNKQTISSSITTATSGDYGCNVYSSPFEQSTAVLLHRSPISMCSTEVDQQRRPDRVGMSRMA